MSKKSITEALGLDPLDNDLENKVSLESEDEAEPEEGLEEDADLEGEEVQLPAIVEDETVADIETARENIAKITKNGTDALSDVLLLARQSESPRAFEVAASLMKTLLDANERFVDMAMKKKEMKGHKAPQEQVMNVTNNNLILSTSDVLKSFLDKKNSDGSEEQ